MHHSSGRTSFPLYAQVLTAVLFVATFGVLFGQEPYLAGLRNEQLGQLGQWVVWVLKMLAIPLIFVAILDSWLRGSIPLHSGGKAARDLSDQYLHGHADWPRHHECLAAGESVAGPCEDLLQVVPGTNLSPTFTPSDHPLQDLLAYIPRTLADPFAGHNIIGVVLLALGLGWVLRWTRRKSGSTPVVIDRVAWAIECAYGWLVTMLWWVILVMPFAVFGVVASVVGRSGIGVFSVLWVFLVAMLLGLAVHALLYYPLVAWVVGKKPPTVYIGQGADAIMTAVSCNSSLATVPITLRCLDRMQVSPQSARLAACVGTNLNNDGITLYEAMAALFLAHALGYDLPMSKQIVIVVASIIAGAGVAGIPEAGMIVLPLVLIAAGLPDQVILAAIPLIMTVDWIIARARSGVNVMSDMLVAILLDARDSKPEAVSIVEQRQ